MKNRISYVSSYPFGDKIQSRKMRNKTIFLLFITGAVAIRGEEEIAEEKESRIADKTGGSGFNDFNTVLQSISKLEEQIQEFFTTTEQKFQGFKEKIERREKQAEDSLKKALEILELSWEAGQNNEMKAKSDGKVEAKVLECLAKEELDFNGDINDDYQNAFDCIKHSAKEARNSLQDAKDAFAENFEDGLGEARKLAHRIQSCNFNSNNSCVRKRMDAFRKKLMNMRDEGRFLIENAKEALENQKEEMFICRENFSVALEQVADAYTTLIKRCMIA